MTGSFFRDLPPEAPLPRFWKMLGRINGVVEMHYSIADLHADFDLDLEAELRAEMVEVANVLTTAGRELEEDGIVLVRSNTYFVRGWPAQVYVRFVPGVVVVFASACQSKN